MNRIMRNIVIFLGKLAMDVMFLLAMVAMMALLILVGVELSDAMQPVVATDDTQPVKESVVAELYQKMSRLDTQLAELNAKLDNIDKVTEELYDDIQRRTDVIDHNQRELTEVVLNWSAICEHD